MIAAAKFVVVVADRCIGRQVRDKEPVTTAEASQESSHISRHKNVEGELFKQTEKAGATNTETNSDEVVPVNGKVGKTPSTA